jgi:hypothetical protein
MQGMAGRLYALRQFRKIFMGESERGSSKAAGAGMKPPTM